MFKHDSIYTLYFSDKMRISVFLFCCASLSLAVSAKSYADAVTLYLSIIVSKTADSNNSFCPWEPVAQCTRQLFGRQAISMLWDFLLDMFGDLVEKNSGGV